MALTLSCAQSKCSPFLQMTLHQFANDTNSFVNNPNTKKNEHFSSENYT